MSQFSNRDKEQLAWKRIETLGGRGVWESDMVVVSLAGTAVTDEDLSLFADFPHVQILDLSNTSIGDAGLMHLRGIQKLEKLIVIGTNVSNPALDAFRRERPTVAIVSEEPPKSAVNPFTGKPF